MDDFRWELADAGAGPQGALFDDVIERHVGKGEYRGLEFLHVNARRIINEVPAASRMPFRFTINAYRGCSHACTYCAVGETRVLMADGRTRPIADLRPGDEVIGTERVGRHRRYVATPVLDHWETVKAAIRTTLDDGTQLVTSGDHRFLTERGWKHVTAPAQGRHHRPHLTVQNSLLGIGRFPEAPKHTDEYQRGYRCGVIRGGRQPDAMGVVHGSGTLFEWPRSPSEEWTRGFLAGVYDAAGHVGDVVRISSIDPVLLDLFAASLFRLAFKAVRERSGTNGVASVRLVGGLSEVARFILTVDPATTRKRTIVGRAMEASGARRVVSIEPLGLDLPMFDITTGTGDFIAEGAVSHNCFARPTHEYLGMNIGEDFERRIVVKINAVERLRAELAPSRWRGDHIAMGTNTDPYQRCEGKYRLTQGIVRELAAARNPFSILTKSTLILRDLDLLAEAAEVTDVRANLSIGSLDEEVWKLTEPGTPHPRLRVEAVAKLNVAGVRCGVLIAPILPGLSDRDDQLEAVVRACIEAGAVSVTPLLLHLRPGVREHYLGWLADARPDLLAEHERLYPKAYAPKATQQALARKVARIVERYGGRSAAPTQTRLSPAAEAPARPRAPAQLTLEV